MDTENYQSKYEGLLIVTKCLNEIIDASGEREKLIKNTKSKIVETYTEASKFIDTEVINKQLQISNQRIFRWTKEKKCKSSVTQHCYNTCPMQLTYTEQNILKKHLLDPINSHLPRGYIWAKMKRSGTPISKDTFYRYANNFCGKPIAPVLEKLQPTIHIRAKEPFQILHMDSTIIRCKDGDRVYIHFIMDNFSRKILGAIADRSSQSISAAENLKQAIEKNNLYHRKFELYCDDGPENKGYIDKLLKNDSRIKITKIVANYKQQTSNNMIESWNKKFKYYILKKFTIYDYECLVRLLPKMVESANNLYLPVLKTLTPNEAITGKKYEDLNLIRQMEKARRIRIQQNRNADCSKLCFDE